MDSIIGGKYLDDASPVPEEQLHIVYMWLENDISSSLKKAEDIDKTYDEICEILNGSSMYSDIIEVISVNCLLAY